MQEDLIYQDLVRQRDAILFGNWVQCHPKAEDEACLVWSGTETLLNKETMQFMADRKTDSYSSQSFHYTYLTNWNDLPGRTRQEVLDFLDSLITVRKEELNG